MTVEKHIRGHVRPRDSDIHARTNGTYARAETNAYRRSVFCIAEVIARVRNYT